MINLFILQVELRLNDYHHLFELSYEDSQKLLLDLKTQSSFLPFNDIQIYFDHEMRNDFLKSGIILKYKERFLMIDLDHETGNNGGFVYEGSHSLKSSLALISSINISYVIKMDSLSKVSADLSCSYNEKMNLKLISSGFASMSRADLDFKITNNVFNDGNIHGKINHTYHHGIFDSNILINSSQKVVKSHVQIERIPEFKVTINFDIDSVNPVHAYLLYAETKEGKILKSEIVYDNIQLVAINFKNLLTDLSNLDFKAEAKIINNKMTFKIKNKIKEKLLYMDIVRSNKLVSVLKMENRQGKKKGLERQDISIVIQTPIETIEDIQINFKQKKGNMIYQTKASVKFKELYWKSETIDKEEHGNLHLYLSAKTNMLMEDNINVTLEKRVESSENQIHMTTESGNQTFTIDNVIKKISESRSELDFKVGGTWGNISLVGYTDFQDVKQLCQITFTDRKGLQFGGFLESNQHDDNFYVKSVIKTPFTDDLTVLASFSMSKSEITIEFSITQPSFEYANLSGNMSMISKQIQFNLNLDFKNMIDFHALHVIGKVSIGETVFARIGNYVLYEMNTKIDIEYNTHPFAGLAFNINKTDFGFAGLVILNTPFMNYEHLNLNMNIDMFGKDKYCNIVFKQNEKEFSCFLKQSKSQSRYIILINISTTIQGYTTIQTEIAYDEANNMLMFKMKKEEDSFSLKAALNLGQYTQNLNLEMENNVFSWKTFSMSGHTNITKHSKSVLLSGGSDDLTQQIMVKLNTELSMGNADIIINLPFLGISKKSFKFSYLDSDNMFETNVNVNGSNFIIKTENKEDKKIAFEIKTPFVGYSTIQGIYNFEKKLELLKGKLMFTIESGDNNTLEININTDLPSVSIDVRTQFNIIRKAVAVINLNPSSSEFVLAYNSYSISGNLDMSTNSQFEGKFKIKTKHPVLSDFQIHFQKKPGHFELASRYNKEMLLSLILNYNQSEKRVIINYNYMENKYHVNLAKRNTGIEYFSNLPKFGETTIRFDWTPKEYYVKVQNNSLMVLEGKLSWDFTAKWTGNISLEVRSLIDYLRHLKIETELDVGKMPGKALKMNIRYNDVFVENIFQCNAQHKKLDGTLVIKSNIVNWEEANIDFSYKLDREPDATISIQRNGKEEEIYVKVIIDGFIPTIEIKTPFYGYEHIVFKGFFKKNNVLFLQLDMNEKTEFIFNLKFTLAADWKQGTIFSYITFPNQEEEPMFNVHLQYDMKTRKNMMVFYETSSVSYMVNANIVVAEKAFFVTIKTPDNEHKLAGQFGTTEIKAVATSGLGRNKREASIDYKLTDNTVTLNLQSPFGQWKGIKFGADYQADAKAASFYLERHGNKTEFAVGMKYNFTDILSAGHVDGKLYYPLSELDYIGHLTYGSASQNAANGFDGSFSFTKSGKEYLTGTISRIPGKTELNLNTPIISWDKVAITLESNWLTFVTLTFTRNTMFSQLHIEKEDPPNMGFLLKMTTPYEGYENIIANVHVPVGDVSVIEILKNDLTVTRISIDIFYQPDPGAGYMKINWDAPNNTYITFDLSFDSAKDKLDRNRTAELHLSSSFEKLQDFVLSIESESKLNIDFTKLRIKFNEYFVNYDSSIEWSNIKIESNSKSETNIPLLKFNKSETEMIITYSRSLDAPFTLQLKTIHDGEIAFNVNSSVMIDIGLGQLEMLYQGNFPLHHGKVDARLILKMDFSTNLEVIGKLDSNEFKFKLKQVDGIAEANLESNYEGYESLRGRAQWHIAEGPSRLYGLETTFEHQTKRRLTMQINFSTNPFHTITGEISIPGYLQESVDLKFQRVPLKLYSLDLRYTGFKNIDLAAEIDLEKISIEIMILNRSENRKWELKANGEIHSQAPVDVKFQLIMETPFTPKFETMLKFDFKTETKHVFTTLTYGVIEASLKIDVLLMLKKSDINFEAACPSLGVNKLIITGRRNKFRNVTYQISYNEKITSLSMRYILNSNDFDAGIEMKLPISRFNALIFNAKGKMTNSALQEGNFQLHLDQKLISLSYILTKDHLKIDIQTPLHFAQNISFSSEVVHCQQYNFKGNWDAHTIVLDNEIDCLVPKLKINYKTTFEVIRSIDLNFTLDKRQIDITAEVSMLGILSQMKFHAILEDTVAKGTLSFSGNETNFHAVVELASHTGDKSVVIDGILNDDVATNFRARILYDENGGDFAMQYTSEMPSLTNFQITLSFKNEIAKSNVAMILSYNDQRVTLEFGSFGGHIYLEIKSPMQIIRVLKMDINIKNGNMKIKIVHNDLHLDADYVKKGSIYNFEIVGKVQLVKFKFDGKIDISGKALQTSLMWNHSTLKMKAKYSGKRITIIVKTPFINYKNILFRGSWEALEDGFQVNAQGEVNELVYLFESIFTRNDSKTSGYWLVKKESEELKFDLEVNKSYGAMDISLNLKLPDMDVLQTRSGFYINETSFSVDFLLKTPFKNIITDLQIGFEYQKSTPHEGKFECNINTEEQILGLKLEFDISDTNNMNVNTLVQMPTIYKNVSSSLSFKFNNLMDVNCKLQVKINENVYGSNFILLLSDTDIDLHVAIISPDISKTLKLGGEYRTPQPSGRVKIYFNNAAWELDYNSQDGFIRALSVINIEDFMPWIYEDFKSTPAYAESLISLELEYTGIDMMKIILKMGDTDCTNMNFGISHGRISGLIDINFPSYDIVKLAKFVLKTGTSGGFEIALLDGVDSIQISAGNTDVQVLNRKKRSVTDTPSSTSGKSDFSQGVFILTTNDDIHKISYNVKQRKSLEITIYLESPWLESEYVTSKFTIDTDSNVYYGRMSLNTHHSVSGYLDMSHAEREFNLEIDSLDLTSKIMLTGSYQPPSNNGGKFDAELVYETKHSLHIEVNSDPMYSGVVELESAFLSFETISVNLYSSKLQLPFKSGILLKYGNHEAKLDNTINLSIFNEIIAEGVYAISELNIDGKMNVHIHMNKKHVTVSFTNNEQFYMIECSLNINKENEIQARMTLITSIPNYEKMDLNIKMTNVMENLNPVRININLLSPLWEFNSLMSWEVSQEDVEYKLKVDITDAGGYFVHFHASKFKRVMLSVDLPVIGFNKLNLNRISYAHPSLIDERFTWDFDILSNLYSGEAKITYTRGYELSMKIESPHQGFNYQTFSVGFSNSDDRKMIKAFIDSKIVKTGIEADYAFSSLNDLVLFLNIDFPMKGWSDYMIHVQNQNNENFQAYSLGLGFEKFLVSVSSHISTKFAHIESKLYDKVLNARFINTETEAYQATKSLKVTLHNKRNTYTSLYVLEKYKSVSALEVKLSDGEQLSVNFKKNAVNNRITMSANNVIYPFEFKALVFNDIDQSQDIANFTMGTVGVKSMFAIDEDLQFKHEVLIRKTLYGEEVHILTKISKFANIFSMDMGRKYSENLMSYDIMMKRDDSKLISLVLFNSQHSNLNENFQAGRFNICSNYYISYFDYQKKSDSKEALSKASMKYSTPSHGEKEIEFSHRTIVDNKVLEHQIVIGIPKNVDKPGKFAIAVQNNDDKNSLQLKFESPDPSSSFNIQVTKYVFNP